MALCVTLGYATVVTSISWWPTTSQRRNPVNISSMSINRQVNELTERKLAIEELRCHCFIYIFQSSERKTIQEVAWWSAIYKDSVVPPPLLVFQRCFPVLHGNCCLNIKCWVGTRRYDNLCFVAFTVYSGTILWQILADSVFIKSQTWLLKKLSYFWSIHRFCC